MLEHLCTASRDSPHLEAGGWRRNKGKGRGWRGCTGKELTLHLPAELHAVDSLLLIQGSPSSLQGSLSEGGPQSSLRTWLSQPSL